MKVKFDLGDQKPTFVDLMENTVEFPTDSEGRTVIPFDSFPSLSGGIRAPADQLADAIAGGRRPDPNAMSSQSSLLPAANGNTEIVLQNNVPRPFEGDLWTLNGGRGA